MSALRKNITSGMLALFAAVLTLDYAASPSEIQKQGLVHIPDSVVLHATSKGGSKKLVFLAPTEQYGIKCADAKRLCVLLTSEQTARPSVWLQRFSYSGEYWLVKAELAGQEIISPAEQSLLLRDARQAKLKAILIVYFIVFLSFLFPVLTRSRYA